jgi:hypothetical protein
MRGTLCDMPHPGESTRQSVNRSDRWAISAAIAAAAGALATFAGALELLTNRRLPPGWIRYQPPWTVPVLIAGLGLLAFAVVLGFIAIRKSRGPSN